MFCKVVIDVAGAPEELLVQPLRKGRPECAAHTQQQDCGQVQLLQGNISHACSMNPVNGGKGGSQHCSYEDCVVCSGRPSCLARPATLTCDTDCWLLCRARTSWEGFLCCARAKAVCSLRSERISLAIMLILNASCRRYAPHHTAHELQKVLPDTYRGKAGLARPFGFLQGMHDPVSRLMPCPIAFPGLIRRCKHCKAICHLKLTTGKSCNKLRLPDGAGGSGSFDGGRPALAGLIFAIWSILAQPALIFLTSQP